MAEVFFKQLEGWGMSQVASKNSFLSFKNIERNYIEFVDFYLNFWQNRISNSIKAWLQVSVDLNV